MDPQPLIDQLTALVPGVQLSASPSADTDVTPALWVSAAHIVPVCLALRDTPGLEFLAFSNLTAVDHHPKRAPRFDVVYHIVSPHRRTRLRLKVQLGLDEPSTLYRARQGQQPVALLFEAVAPDGYAGKVRLLIALRADGTVAGVRVTQHKETPGLGDYVEPKKDKDKAHPWIGQFQNLSFTQTADKEWKVKKDGGRFDYHAGATVTPRAIIKAVYKAVKWANANRDQLFAQTGGAR